MIRISSPFFSQDGVLYKPRYYWESLTLCWNTPHKLVDLKKKRYLLPDTYEEECSGVYRIFVPDTTIDRCCGGDPTGTLYVGSAGTKDRSWSILRTRILEIVNKRHHATHNVTQRFREKFAWATLAVQWAYTDRIFNYKGKRISGAPRAESWLLSTYNKSFGEYPPWNQKG